MESVLAVLVFFPFGAGIISYIIGVFCLRNGGPEEKQETARDAWALLAAALEFAVMLLYGLRVLGPDGVKGQPELVIPGVCGMSLGFTMDGFRAVYGCVASFMWMMASFFSREYMERHRNRNRYYLFLLVTLGAVMGVFFSSNLYTTFLFFEIMSFTSYVWVAQEENRPSLRAAETYLAVAVIGGLVMLMGIFLLNRILGTLEISELTQAAAECADKGLLYAAGGCMLVGFGAKAGAFPLHIWLPKAHPVAPAPASALLSGILTKTGVYGILILSCDLFLHDKAWGIVILGVGLATMLGGAILAVFSIDLKRTLACSSMSQIGFILVGIGMQGLLGEENALAVHGTMLHMVNHSLIKLALFLAAGVIYMNTHALNLNEIRGFGRKKPFLAACFLTGALAIGGIPLFGGYISKTLLHESIVEYGGGKWMAAAEALFLFSGGLTIAYMTKLFVAVFMEKNPDEKRQAAYDGMGSARNPLTFIALGGSALVLFFWGIAPRLTMEPAARLAQSFMGFNGTAETISYFSLTNLRGAAISIAIGILVYALVVRKLLMKRESGTGGSVYADLWPKWLDLENLLYRPLLLSVFPTVLGIICRALDSLVDTVVVLLRKSVYRNSPLPYERPEGNLFTVVLGNLLNVFQAVGNLTWRRKNPVHKDYVHLAAMKGEELRETGTVIQRSLSFGLLLFCIGLTLTLIYLVLLRE